MSTSQAVDMPPWGTGLVVALNVGLYLVVGSAEEYRLGPQADRDLPSIGRMLVDVVRHGSVSELAVTVVFLAPVGWRLERLIGAVGVTSTYLVGGFIGGFVEILRASDDLAVVGAMAGTVTLLAAWAHAHWRLQGALVAPVVVLAVWSWAHAVLTPAATPWTGLIAAGAVGLYATRGTGAAR